MHTKGQIVDLYSNFIGTFDVTELKKGKSLTYLVQFYIFSILLVVLSAFTENIFSTVTIFY